MFACKVGKTLGFSKDSKQPIRTMLEFAAEHDIGTKESPSPYIQKYNMDHSNYINKTLPDSKAGKPRFRFVFVNTRGQWRKVVRGERVGKPQDLYTEFRGEDLTR